MILRLLKINIHKTFWQFYKACWEKNKKLTLFFTIFVLVATYDEIIMFFEKQGTAYKLWDLLKYIVGII